jgi:hypothetical protein
MKKIFAPMVFEKGYYIVHVQNSENGKEKVLKRQQVVKELKQTL